jgi:hypothetical protein
MPEEKFKFGGLPLSRDEKIIEAKSKEELEVKIRLLIEQGWETVGEVDVITTYVQKLSKKKGSDEI